MGKPFYVTHTDKTLEIKNASRPVRQSNKPTLDLVFWDSLKHQPWIGVFAFLSHKVVTQRLRIEAARADQWEWAAPPPSDRIP
jgi:hypothetical protein